MQTQHAIDAEFGGGHKFGSTFVSVAIFFFAFTSIIANYYYGETNTRFIRDSRTVVNVYRLPKDYKEQKRRGLDPVYHSTTIPELAPETECWV